MAIRDKIQANAQPHLEPGEQIQAVWPCQSHSAWLMVATGVIPFVIFNKYMTVVATDRRILVGDSGRWTTTKFKSVLAEVPRQTAIGPASGLWYKTEALGLTARIHKRFHKDVAEADAAVGLGAPVPGAAAPVSPPPAPPAA